MALRGGLRLAEIFYAAEVGRRNRLFDTRKATVHRMAVPVISVGNITLGGTGKTPMVEWLVRWFHSQELRAGVVSRGYGAAKGEQNDEALELARRLPDVPHVQSPDRVAAARLAVTKHGCQVLVLDDGFQHRRLGRDLDIVLLDALEPFGFGHVFPRGTLREPLDGLARADVVVVTRADMLEAGEREAIWETVGRYAPNATCAAAAHVPWGLVAANGKLEPLTRLRSVPVAAFCGLGNSAGFRRTVESCGCQLAGFREFPDHHRYTPADIRSIADWVKSLRALAVLCTQKDLVKLSCDTLADVPLWAVGIEIDFLAGQDATEDRLAALL